jgi:HEAT repeat protein
LVTIGAAAVEPLLAALGRAESAARDQIVRALGKLGDQRAIDPLLGVLRSERAWVAREALAGLGPEVVDRMAELLGSNEPALRREAVEVLILVLRPMLFGLDSEAGALVMRSLDDPDDGVRATAVRALDSLRDERTIAVLVARLRDKNSSVRYYAISALSAVASPEAAAHLVPMLRDANSEVRYHVGEALARLGDGDTDAMLAASLAERDLRAWWLRPTSTTS